MDDIQTQSRNIATDETSRLIASNKVAGTAVYDTTSEKLGSIHNLMIEKRSGQVEYAVLTYGGLFGVGGEYYPLPWNVLRYDSDLNGYVVDLDRKLLENGPRYAENAHPDYSDNYGREIYTHYGLNYPF